MPKAVREVKSFNLGVVTSADDNDIKADAAVFSKNIDPNSVAGRLKGRPGDILLDIPKYRGDFVFLKPNADTGDGDIAREVDVKYYDYLGNQLTDNNILGGYSYYKIDVRLQGTVPSSDVVTKINIDRFGSMAEYIKINDTADTSGYPNSGQYIELTFTSSNWEAVQSCYLIPQNISDQDNEEFTLEYTSNSSDASWTHTDRDFNKVFTYVSNVVAGVMVKRSTFKLHDVAEGEMEEFKVEIRLTEPPGFENNDDVVSIKFRSSDQTELYVHKTSSEESKYLKTLSFTQANYSTYQTIHPFSPDDETKDGNQVYQLLVSATTNGSVRYDELEENIQNCVKFDDGNFVTNDFPHDGSSEWNVIVLEAGEHGSNDDGTGDDSDDDDGWAHKGGP